jgi:hypothetical protein
MFASGYVTDCGFASYIKGYATDFSDTTRTNLVAALQPLLVTGRVTHVLLRLRGFMLGAAEVAVLGRVGGAHITCLTIAELVIRSDFWSSVLPHLPRLDTLVYAKPYFPASFGGGERLADFAAFCSSAPRPITLKIAADVLPKGHFEKLQQHCQLQGLSLVTLSRPGEAEL